jgi:hypothetical protein
MSISPADVTQMQKYFKSSLSKFNREKTTVIIDVGFEVQTVVVMTIELFNDY